MNVQLTCALATCLALASCAQTQASEPDWNQMPSGGQAYVSKALASDDCSPLNDAVGFTKLMEDSTQEKTALYDYLQHEAIRRDCSAPSTDELLAEVMGVRAKDLEQLMSTPNDQNPLYHGPGCMGAVQSIDDYMQLQTVADEIQMLGVRALTVTAMMNTIPDAVGKTGTQDPSKTENVTVNVVSQLLNDRESFTRPRDGQKLDTGQQMSKMLVTQLIDLCVRDYQEAIDGPVSGG